MYLYVVFVKSHTEYENELLWVRQDDCGSVCVNYQQGAILVPMRTIAAISDITALLYLAFLVY